MSPSTTAARVTVTCNDNDVAANDSTVTVTGNVNTVEADSFESDEASTVTVTGDYNHVWAHVDSYDIIVTGDGNYARATYDSKVDPASGTTTASARPPAASARKPLPGVGEFPSP